MPKVFVTHESPNFNYTPAEKFGEIEFLTATDLSTQLKSKYNRIVVDEIRNKLDEFTQDDYLLPSGSPIVTGVAMAILHETFEEINVLKWSNHTKEYTPMVVRFDYYNA